MRDPEQGNTPRPSNAFTPEFLAQLDRRDEPVTAAQADAAGPWIVEEIPSPGWAVLRRGESVAAGEALLRMPESLAQFLAAGGAVALERAGRLLAVEAKSS